MPQKTLDPEILNQWLGNTEQSEDVINLRQANLMCATFGQPQDMQLGDDLPPLWHWIYFLSAVGPSELGRDGHPMLGGFLPPVALPRRMWAGGRFEFFHPIHIGDKATKTSRIEAITPKTGRSGTLCFVTVSHTISVNGQVCLREEHDIVYREDPKPDAPAQKPQMAPQDPDWHKEISVNPVTLFRYSALTFNGHRIHYDRIYNREVEGYPDLVVHGPLIGTFLIDLAVKSQPDRLLKHYSFRALSPVFDTAPFHINGKLSDGAAILWATKPDGTLAVQAKAEFL